MMHTRFRQRGYHEFSQHRSFARQLFLDIRLSFHLSDLTLGDHRNNLTKYCIKRVTCTFPVASELTKLLSAHQLFLILIIFKGFEIFIR